MSTLKNITLTWPLLCTFFFKLGQTVALNSTVLKTCFLCVNVNFHQNPLMKLGSNKMDYTAEAERCENTYMFCSLSVKSVFTSNVLLLSFPVTELQQLQHSVAHIVDSVYV